MGQSDATPVIVVDSYKLQQFYEQHLPEEVVDRATLEKVGSGA